MSSLAISVSSESRKVSTKATLNEPALLAARQAHITRLQALYDGERLNQVFVLAGIAGRGQADLFQEPERWVEEALADLAEKAERVLDQAVFRPLVIEPGELYGVHFVDKILGAPVFELDQKANWQAHYLESPIGELQMPDLDQDPSWKLARQLATAFVESGVTVPFFGLPTIASVLNIAVNLYGQQILVALYTDPAAAQRDLQVINQLLCDLHSWYLAHLPAAQLQPVVAGQRTQPPGFGQICGCTTQLLSPRLYQEFVAPLDEALLSVYPHGGMIHLCGQHTQHIPVWREMHSLRAVQMNDRATEDLETYFRELREDQILYVNPCASMPVERIMAITGGRRTVIVADLPEAPRVA
jgi:hypothetical protein